MMNKPIADYKERSELLTDIMRGETLFEVPHPDFPDVMIYQQSHLQNYEITTD